MLKSSFEEFNIQSCPLCAKKHLLKVEVFRDILQNDINKDVRVPVFKKVFVPVTCPSTNKNFNMDLYLQEDVYSLVKKIKRA